LVAVHGWLRRADLIVLLAMLTVVLGVWGFLALSDEVREGGTQSFDERLLIALRRPNDLSQPIGPPWLHEAGRDMTALGGVAVLSLLTVLVLGYLIMRRRPGAFALVLSAVGAA
jgi:undecaprenyl-diphosphatase